MLLAWARALLLLTCLAATARAVADPTFTVQLAVRDGIVRVDRDASTLDLAERAAALKVCPKLTPEVIKVELADYLDKLLSNQGTLIEFLAAPLDDTGNAQHRATVLAALRRLAETDDRTKALYRLNSTSWQDVGTKFGQWLAAHRSQQPPVFTAEREVGVVPGNLLQDARLAEGPLLPQSDPDDSEARQTGRLIFKLSPPLLAAATRLRSSTNPDEIVQHLEQMSQALLGPFECGLWSRESIVRAVQDYMELRGVTTQAFRTAKDLKDARPLSIPEQPEPMDFAGVAPERPSFTRKDFGGRVLLSADPILDAVLIDVVPKTYWATVERALYLLLPTQDWQRVSAEPTRYICELPAEWKPHGEHDKAPTVLRLSLVDGPGAELNLGRVYLTRRTYAERLQRLDVVGLTARTIPSAEKGQRKATNLLIEPLPNGEDKAVKSVGPDLPECGGVPAAKPAEPEPVSTASLQDVVAPVQRDAPHEHRNTISGGVEYQAGKPLRPSVSFSHEGSAAEGTWSGEVAQQRQASTQFAYSRDFFYFDKLRRRVQVSASAYSLFTPERPAAANVVTDERREGIQARATIDLWRDGGGGIYGQLELGANRDDVVQEGSTAPKQRLTVADASVFVGGAAQGTPRSERWESGATLAVGHSSTASRNFAKLQIQAAYNQFVRSFERWDMRARLSGVTSDTPQSEWPTFGGDDSVRGYKVEAAAARRTWILQNEYWTPLSFLARSNEDLARTLRRSVALALFADIGGLSSGTAQDGTRAGVGAGLRVTLSDAFVLRLDWARPIGSTRGLGDRDNRFYLTFTTFRTL
jgi:hypothetical protein